MRQEALKTLSKASDSQPRCDGRPGDALGRKAAAVDAAIIGIVDHVDYVEAP